ncbi:acetyl-CoA carboxylase, biotin carboxylase subunit [Lentilactobacillus farraginis DSM 18382 = JCM 14108]|uniref:biotin carboxylase n=1 Tax=Lentilactobacillus farraginis DSM 18382 = JCM 14108 TaxID=1423743 RepID=A0A0R1WC59_9LACO|nr:acetyl-CoA carboxylase, biotin carboxylase subunit [Lentilactobacillus farraginis DSM 18382 = JCM 14108]
MLVANRGEIAVRIIRACRTLGLQTVAVYSTVDKTALHTQLADEAVCVGPAEATKSYLNMTNLIEAAKLSGADAIHPGYGFLSENSEFAKRVVESGFVYIGADSAVIALLGDKEMARKTMQDAGMPVVRGSSAAVQKVADAQAQARKIGFPIMLKASAGGGGKGMRVIRSASELTAGFSAAQDEAREAFGDDHMYLEQYLMHPRHIEVQVIADQAGQVIAIGERDCTIQTNHQKVIEEAPAVVLDENSRVGMLKICEQAVKKLHYVGLGTIEFLYNGPGEYYFMEMNTRIQVEHPITELTASVDLVTAQLRVAAGDLLTQSRPQINGFAMECRLNALTPGTITGLHLPGGYGVRVDTAIYQGYQVPAYYDAMIAKIIVFGHTRPAVLRQMRQVIDETVVSGVQTNLDVLAQILSESAFQKLTTDVNWLDKQLAATSKKEK